MHTYVFFFNDTATTEIYTLSLHDALPIFLQNPRVDFAVFEVARGGILREGLGYGRNDVGVVLNVTGDHLGLREDRKSTRLNSSHANISYAVFCLKKKKYLSIFIPDVLQHL